MEHRSDDVDVALYSPTHLTRARKAFTLAQIETAEVPRDPKWLSGCYRVLHCDCDRITASDVCTREQIPVLSFRERDVPPRAGNARCYEASENNTNTKMVYLDNAATAFPRAPGVAEAMFNYLNGTAGNIARSVSMNNLDDSVLEARGLIAKLIAADLADRIVFTSGATESLNVAILGSIPKNSHVVTTVLEHNSVIRPLRFLERTNDLRITIVECDHDGYISPLSLKKAMMPDTSVVVVSHGSNVVGSVQNIEEIGAIVRKRGAMFCVDAAQTIGCIPINVNTACIDLLAFSGHKGLMGPPGIGVLYVGERCTLSPLMHGGTGSASEVEEQPWFYPDCLEAGTPNLPGIIGLAAAVRFILSKGIKKLHEKEVQYANQILDGASRLDLPIYGPVNLNGPRTAVVSVSVPGYTSDETAFMLSSAYGISCRYGLHCAPWTHRFFGTYPDGTVRFSPGYFTKSDEIDYLLNALTDMVKCKTKATSIGRSL